MGAARTSFRLPRRAPFAAACSTRPQDNFPLQNNFCRAPNSCAENGGKARCNEEVCGIEMIASRRARMQPTATTATKASVVCCRAVLMRFGMCPSSFRLPARSSCMLKNKTKLQKTFVAFSWAQQGVGVGGEVSPTLLCWWLDGTNYSRSIRMLKCFCSSHILNDIFTYRRFWFLRPARNSTLLLEALSEPACDSALLAAQLLHARASSMTQSSPLG